MSLNAPSSPASLLKGEKPWWLSKGVMGPIFAMVSVGFGAATGVHIDPATQGMIIDNTIGAVSGVGMFLGSAIGIVGRFRATARIK